MQILAQDAEVERLLVMALAPCMVGPVPAAEVLVAADETMVEQAVLALQQTGGFLAAVAPPGVAQVPPALVVAAAPL